VFAAFNHLAADDRELVVYPYNGREAGEGYQWQRQVAWLSTRL
jgi:cephalosporin-C deacetylase